MFKRVVYFIFVTVFTVSCGVKDKKEGASTTPQSKTLNCASRHILSLKNESHALSFSPAESGSSLDFKLDEGDTLLHFDWGQVEKTSELGFNYKAPAFVPEFRTLEVKASDPRSSDSGICKVHLLDDFTYGAMDDGNTKGLIAKTYLGTSLPLAANNIALSTSVVRNLDFLNLPNFAGITNLTNGVIMRFTGTLNVPAAGAHWFRLTARNNGELTIDGVKIGTTTNGTTGTEFPLTTAPAYATGVNLSAGKHTILVDLMYNNGGQADRTLRLEWTRTKPTATVKPYEIIPYAAFDRD